MEVDKQVSRPDRPPAGDEAADERGSGSPIEFRLDPSSGVPTFLQLVQQVEHALRLGYLTPGDQLPKVRDVVASLAINPNTVLKAYRDLEIKGLDDRPARPGHVHPGHAEPGPAARVDRTSPLLVGLADHRRRGRAGRGRDGGALHQRAAGFL